MAGSTHPPHLPEALSRELELGAALAREQLLDTHLRFLLEFVERARNEVPPPRVLSIYTRLHHLPPSDGLLLAHRLMVVLGRREGARRADIRPPGGPSAGGLPWTYPATLLARIARRLRGRVNPGLRQWVEVHTGRAEIALLEVHVENAVRFIEILHPAESYAAAVEIYAGMLGVPAARIETLYFMTLDRLGHPAHPPESALTTDAPRPPVPLRVIENHG